MQQLAAEADVLLENYKVGGLKKYGLDYPTLKAINPRLVYCSITGFGQTGPYASRPGYDYIVQGMSGLMSITGPADGEPHKVGVAVTDLFTGLYASNAICAALLARERSGEGQAIDLALFDCALAMLANINMNWLVGGETPPRLGNAHPNIVPYQVFATSDGHFILACGNDSQFARIAELCGHAEWAADPRFARNADRVAHRAELVPLLAEVFVTRTRDEWQAALDAGAYGIHVGQEDLDVIGQRDLQTIRSSGTRLGVSTHGYAEMVRAHAVQPSYIALGAVFPTTLKKMATAPQGLARLAAYVRLMHK